MLESELIATARIADGGEFVLLRRDKEWMVRVGGRTLMSSRMHDSEEALAEHALERVEDPGAVLVGGLGLGFTLRAVLDRVAEDATVTVAELVPELVAWNHEYLADLHDRALDDPRCDVVVADVLDTIKSSRGVYDVILLDVDNGPVALSKADNQRIYSDAGVRACHAALRPDGVLAVWSAGPSPPFERRLASAGFEVEVMRVRAREGSRARHVLFLAKRSFAARGSRPYPRARGR